MIRFTFLLLVLLSGAAQADERFITLSSTTSTQDSGLFGYILPIFKTATGLNVHVLAVGTGQALAIGERGDADALLVHDRIGEDKFVAEGYGIDRRDVMYNDFVIVGPNADPAHIRGLKDARTALTQIAAAKAPFASRLTVCAVNVRTGELTSFDTTTHKIDARHIVASGSLPPGFPATEIDGEYYWDGGVASNSILHVVLDSPPQRDTLAFQIDVWSASGELPRDMIDADAREKDIRFSSRSRAAINHFRTMQRARHALRKALEAMPDNIRKSAEIKRLETEADETSCNVVHLIYQAKTYEGVSKDYEFSRQTMEEHWRSGHEDASRAISYPEIFERPDAVDGFRAFDFFGRHISEGKNQPQRVAILEGASVRSQTRDESPRLHGPKLTR